MGTVSFRNKSYISFQKYLYQEASESDIVQCELAFKKKPFVLVTNAAFA